MRLRHTLINWDVISITIQFTLRYWPCIVSWHTIAKKEETKNYVDYVKGDKSFILEVCFQLIVTIWITPWFLVFTTYQRRYKRSCNQQNSTYHDIQSYASNKIWKDYTVTAFLLTVIGYVSIFNFNIEFTWFCNVWWNWLHYSL